ncbi:MAG: hypothetical protein E7585_05680 [Ruminococcaceae bacterium]|nr:hypothetical protein [Oscillospiraceae bacterium]
MKKFLSMLLAVLMVVSVMVPTLSLFVGAEGDAEAEQSASGLPELIITELVTNAYGSGEIYSYLDPQTAMPQEKHYQQLNLAVDASCKDYFEKVEGNNGVISFVKTTDTKAVAGKIYYYERDMSANDTEVMEYYEIYNASDRPINLYDYKIARDADAATDGSTVTFTDMKPGAVEATKYGEYFKYVGTGDGALAGGFVSGVQYYTKDGATYTPVRSGSPRAGVNYYVHNTEPGYHFVNPDYEKGVLQPGQIAVVWNYNQASWRTFCNEETFKSFYTAFCSPKTDENPKGQKNYYECDLYSDDILVIAVNAVSGAPYMGDADGVKGFWLDEWGQMNYGIVPDSVTNTLDTARYDQWTSWAFWGSHAGIDVNQYLVKQTVAVGETTVVDVKFVVEDELTGEYRSPSLADGTADENGKAIAGVDYYLPTLHQSDDDHLSNKVNGKAIHYLYGLDDTVPMKEGVAYTIYSGDMTPGILNNIQKFVLPNHSTGLNTRTETPDIVFTEVVPDNVGDDDYEFLEVVNTSGRAINMFDYSVGALSSYRAYTSEYFNKINPIIPGDVGNILANDPGCIYYKNAPTNMDYASGWLQPGETAVLWSYYNTSYAKALTFDDFRNHFGMDSSTKIFAMDTDNTAFSGRQNERQNLGNTGQYIYGLIPNENMDWYGDVWVSNPVFKPITYYESGKTHATSTGIPLEACESFVLCAAAFVSFANVSPGEDYGYQFTWKTVEGTPNRFGIYVDMARLTNVGGSKSVNGTNYYPTFAATGSIVTSEWKASPGKLIEAQKTAVTTNMGDSRYVLYMQDFNGLGQLYGYDAVAAALGLTGVTENSILLEEHLSNVAMTEAGGTPFLEIRDGKLYINNKGNSDDYMVLMSDEVLDSLRDKDFTLEYAMTYAADSTNGRNGYSSVLYNFDGATLSYGAPIVRISGYGHNAVVRNGSLIAVEDASGTNSMANTAVSGSNPLTLYERLKGNVNAVGFNDTVEGSVLMAGTSVKVRVDVSRTTGVTVSVNDIVVSRTFDVAASATFADWSLFLEETVGSDLALITTPDISVAYDYITLYAGSITMDADTMDIPSLYITELNVSGGNNIYVKGSTAKTDLTWIEYIEIANGSNDPVALKDYVIVGTKKNGLMHHGNNLQWLGDGDNVYLTDWLGTDNYNAKLEKSNSGTCDKWYNPSENEAVLQPGEVALIFVVNSSTNFNQKNQAGETVSLIEAACDWLQIDLNAADAPLCILTCQQSTTITDVALTKDADGNITAVTDKGNARTGAGIAGYDTASCCYGIGRLNDKSGNRIDWKTVYTHDYRYLESMVDLNHSIAFGQNNTGITASDLNDIGNGGASLGGQGYCAQYVYGQDASSFYKIGTLWTRRNNPIMTWYKSGTETVDKAGQYNVGKLYDYQAQCLRDIRELAAKGYQSGGGLVITEYVYDNTDASGGVKDTFETMEITNTSATPINLYEYSYVSSKDANYGSNAQWTYMTKFHPGCPVPRNHALYEQLKDIYNPEQCIVEPGESVLIWVYCWDSNDYFNGNGNGVPQTVEDFRNHWAELGNDMIKAVDENGEYKVKVVMAVAFDGAPAGNLSNTLIAKAYGICKNTDVYFNGVVRGAAVVSYMVSPIHPYYHDLRWAREQLTSNANVGVSITGNFEWDEMLVEEVNFETDTALSNLCVKNGDGTYTFATAPYDQSVQHYRLYFYHNKQTIYKGPDYTYNFCYGEGMTSGWGVSSMIETVKASKVVQPSGGKKFGITADAASWTPQVVADILSVGIRDNSFGYLLPEQKGMLNALAFTYVGDMDDGTKVYFHDSVAGEMVDAYVTNTIASVSVNNNQTYISFTSSAGSDYLVKMMEHFGNQNVTWGIISARASEAMEAGMLRPELLEGRDHIVDDQNLYSNQFNGVFNFYGNAQKMDPGYYSTTYSAVGFVRVTTDAFGDVTLYASTAMNLKATQVLASAMFDYKDAMDEDNGYIYEISAGKWSRYTAAQIARFEAIVEAHK